MLANCIDTKQNLVERGTVSIKVVSPTAGKGIPVRVSVYEPKDGKRGVEIQAHETGSDGIANFVLPMGHYEIRAFVDLDRNGKPGPNEPAGALTGIEPDPDVHNEKPPLVLTLTMPPPGSVPAEVPDADKKKGKGAAPAGKAAAPASGSTPAAGTSSKTSDGGGAGVPLPPSPKP
jgi:hypothetical protein